METAEQTTLIMASDPLADDIHRAMLATAWPARIIKRSTVESAIVALASHHPTTFIIEIDGDSGDGFRLLQRAGEVLGSSRPFAFILMGSGAAHAIRAFETGAVDYLLLPIDERRFSRALARLRDAIGRVQFEKLNDRLQNVLNAIVPMGDRRRQRTGIIQRYVERIGIRVGNRWVVVKSRDIQCITGAGVYVQIIAGGRTFLLRATMAEVEARLDPDRFVRIHRSTIVNTEHLKEVCPHRHGEYVIVMEDGSRLKASRSYGGRIREIVNTVG